jgi:hypothetical protein
VLGLGLDILSFDTGLSLSSVLECREALEGFLDGGGRLSLGVIPTTRPSGAVQGLESSELFEICAEPLRRAFASRPELVHKCLSESVYTPACGLALHSPWDADAILSALKELKRYAAHRMESAV